MLQAILESGPTLSALAFVWKERLGEKVFAQAAETWLVPVEGRAGSHPCKECGRPHRIHWHSDNDIVSLPPEDSYCKRQALSFEGACLLRFDLHCFTEQLCEQLSIIPDKKRDLSRFPYRIGWIDGASQQYPAYLFLGDPSRAEQAAKNLLHEEESPFVLISSPDLPELFPLFKKKKCALVPLLKVAGVSSAGVETLQTGQELFAGFLRGADGAVYAPPAGVNIVGDYARVVFPDGFEVRLSSGTVRRSMVRFTHQWVQQSGCPEFDVETIRNEHNKRHPDRSWESDRFREDLFKRHEAEFDRLFETLDAAGGRFRIKF